MNKKQNDLLQYLIKKKDVATSNEISTAIGVSVRSVKNYVNEINNMYTNKVILSSRNGYQINPHFSLSLFADYSVEVPQTNEERSFYIIKQLLLAQQQDMDLFELSDFLCISYSTVK
ncbi:MAG: HTH domain-containing protein, partial [Erysipelotrichaceae bacterium]|nr:HTH domain-containing protein [Erysipelotrichaceae bacterium]